MYNSITRAVFQNQRERIRLRTVLFVARDHEPSNALHMFAEQLSRSYTVISHLGDDLPSNADPAIMSDDIDKADIVIAGMSLDPQRADKEIYAVSAARTRGKPYLLFSDVEDSWYERQWFMPYIEKARGLLVTEAREVPKVGKIFPFLYATSCGNPCSESEETPFTKPGRASALLSRTLMNLME